MNDVILLSMPGGGELIVILIIVLILFGARRIPEIAQGLGKGIREFKKAMKDVQSEIDTVNTDKTKLEPPQKSEPDKSENKNG
jgi:sec-independent protein translocase protein TatA